MLFSFRKFLGDQRLYSEREDFCEDFISMAFQIMLVIVYYIYTWIFEDKVSEDKGSFYYLAIKSNKILPKADKKA